MAENRFFTEAFTNFTPEDIEAYHKQVILGMEGPKAEELRRKYYKTQLRSMGENVVISPDVRFINPGFISLGNNVKINPGCTLYARGERGIHLMDGVRLKDRVYLDTENKETGYIEIGERVYVGTGCCLHGHKGLEIGADSLLAQNITLTPFSHKFEDPHHIIYGQGGNSRLVRIGRDCYIGMNVTVVYSADIGEGAVVGAGSVVVKTIPPFSVAVGVPAKVIRHREKQ